MVKGFFGILSLCLLSSVAEAGNLVFFDANLAYTSDAFKSASTDSAGATLYDISVGFGASKDNQIQVGWNYTGQSMTSSSGGTTKTYVSTQMGPRFVFYFDKAHTWRTSFAYNLQTSATYTDGASSSEKWKGTGMLLDFGYQLKITEGFAVGFRINYATASYKESLVGETTYSTVSYTRTYIYPSIGLTCEL